MSQFFAGHCRRHCPKRSLGLSQNLSQRLCQRCSLVGLHAMAPGRRRLRLLLSTELRIAAVLCGVVACSCHETDVEDSCVVRSDPFPCPSVRCLKQHTTRRSLLVPVSKTCVSTRSEHSQCMPRARTLESYFGLCLARRCAPSGLLCSLPVVCWSTILQLL